MHCNVKRIQQFLNMAQNSGNCEAYVHFDAIYNINIIIIIITLRVFRYILNFRIKRKTNKYFITSNLKHKQLFAKMLTVTI